MGSTGRTPNVYGIPATLNWCVESIAQLKGQVFGIIQNGGTGSPQVNSDWDATTGVAEILNKPNVVENPFTEEVSAGSYKITNLSTPTADMDAANKAYVDTFVTGLSPKTAVRVATTDPLIGLYDNDLGTFTMTTTGILAVDGVNLVQGNRVLIKNQVSQIQNGIYDVTTEGILGVATIFTRSSDANTGAELVSAYTYTSTEGFTQASKGYVQKTADPITLGSSDIVWILFNSNAYGEGTGITIGTGNLIYSNLSTGIPGIGNVGQPVRGGTTSEGALTIVGSISTDPRTTAAPAVIVSSAGPLGDDNTAQVHMSVPLTVAQSSTAGYTGIKLAVTETSLGSGTKNLIELLAGAAGTSSRFAVANTGTITVAAGANRFANDVPATSSDANFTLSLIQNETWIRTGFTVPRVITVPLDATVAFPIGAQINIAQWGAGTVTFAGESSSVNIRSKGSLKTINGQWVWVTLKKVDANEWALIGDLTT